MNNGYFICSWDIKSEFLCNSFMTSSLNSIPKQKILPEGSI